MIPCHKKGFTQRAASQALKRMPRKNAPTRSYRCSACGRWHLTSQPARGVDIDAAQERDGYTPSQGTDARGLSMAEVLALAEAKRKERQS